jgi:hypothetical protein
VEQKKKGRLNRINYLQQPTVLTKTKPIAPSFEVYNHHETQEKAGGKR